MPDAMEANARGPSFPLASGIQAAENSQDRSQLAQNRRSSSPGAQPEPGGSRCHHGPLRGEHYSGMASVRSRSPSDRGGRTGLQEGASPAAGPRTSTGT